MRPLELGEPVAVYSFPAVCVLFLFVWLYSVSAWLYRNYAFSALCQEMHPSSEQTIFHGGKENVLFHTNKITVNTTAGKQLSLCSQKCPERHVCVTDPHSSVSAGALLKAQTLNRECSLAGVSVSCCAVCIRGYCFSSVCAPPGRSTDFSSSEESHVSCFLWSLFFALNVFQCATEEKVQIQHTSQLLWSSSFCLLLSHKVWCFGIESSR